MKLVQPTDFEILDQLQEGRNVAANISIELNKDRAYINTRLPELADYGLLQKVGPSPNSGLYEITDLGEYAVIYQDKYDVLNVNLKNLSTKSYNSKLIVHLSSLF